MFINSKSYQKILGDLRGLRAKIPNDIRLNLVSAAAVHSRILQHSKEINKSNSSFKDFMIKNKRKIFQFVFYCKMFLVPELVKAEGMFLSFVHILEGVEQIMQFCWATGW